MNTHEEERISSRYLPGPEREPGQETLLLPLLHPPPEELEVRKGRGSARWRNRKGSQSHRHCWTVSIGSRPELGEGRSYEEYLGLDILIMEERLYLLL